MSKGWTFTSRFNQPNQQTTQKQSIFAEMIKRESKIAGHWQRQGDTKAATRDIITGQERLDINPYPNAREIGPPEIVDESKGIPQHRSSKLKLIRQVEVPYTRVERVPVTVKKLIQVQVDKKMPVKKMVSDTAGTREVQGFQVVRVPEQREVEEVEYQDRVINDTKILEVEEMQEFEWDPVPTGPSTVLRTTPFGGIQGRGITPVPSKQPKYVRTSFLGHEGRAPTPKQAWGQRTATPVQGRRYTPQSRPQSRPQSARPSSRQQQTYSRPASRQQSRKPMTSRPVSARASRAPTPQYRAPTPQYRAPTPQYRKPTPRPQTARPSSRSTSRRSSRAATPSYMNPTKSSQQRVKSRAPRNAQDVRNSYDGNIQVIMGTAEPVYENYRQKNGGMTPPPAKYHIDSRRYY